jgi:Protein of unknown function (DUF2490)
MKHLIGATMLVAITPGLAQAATEDLQQWSTISVQGKLADNITGTAEIVGRFTDDISRLGQMEMRGVIGTPVSKKVTISVGFVHVITYNRTGRDGIEETPFAQVNWNMGKLFGGSLSSRTRLEDRFARGASNMALRARSQVKWSKPLKANGPNAVISLEPFYSFNRTSAVRPGIDQVRTFAGVNFRLSKHADMDVGYLNQYLNRATGDRSNHAISVSLGFKY